ncbi:hypothetical protein [Streptomyces griseorubiginosus]|uniref:hypothetical protein n=1 Tax=Streptomyces griseorubiginosus TaxID=67304 RepID=UPI0036EAB82C
MPHPVLLCGADGRVLAANPAAVRCDDQLRPGAGVFDLRPDDTAQLRQQLAAWLRSGSRVPGALVLKDRFLHHQPEAAFPDDRALLAFRFPPPS